MNDSPLLLSFAPHQIAPWLIEQGFAKILFITALVLAGLLSRRLPPFEMALVCAVSALTFSWAFADQYMAPSLGAIAIFLNLGFLFWLLLASLYVIGDVNSLGIPPVTPLEQKVVPEHVWIGQDLFPWLFIEWILMVFGLSRQAWHMTPLPETMAREHNRSPTPSRGKCHRTSETLRL